MHTLCRLTTRMVVAQSGRNPCQPASQIPDRQLTQLHGGEPGGQQRRRARALAVPHQHQLPAAAAQARQGAGGGTVVARAAQQALQQLRALQLTKQGFGCLQAAGVSPGAVRAA